jgi:F-type H+-transporting ATPase subunit gamma
MPGLKAIRRRFMSIGNTRQITRAMKLVSAAKLKRAEETAIAARVFLERLETALAAVLSGLPADFRHPLLAEHEEDRTRTRLVVVAGERGLCGAYNTNVFKAVQTGELKADFQGDVVAIGRRTAGTAKRLRWRVERVYEGLPDDITKWPIDKMAQELFEGYRRGDISAVVVYYTRFISGLQQEITRERLVPLDLKALNARLAARSGAAIREGQFRFSPPPAEVLDFLVPLYIKAKLRSAILESKASEHASRMAAMDAATTNADDLIAKLRLFYNRARQSAITRELIDIIGGAEALE